jgi:ferric-dicitrate binding protein FerR (iron transport regulator)
MKQAPDLQSALRRLASALPRDAAPATEQRVLAAFRARRNQHRRTLQYLAGLAACLVLTLAWFLLQHSWHRLQPSPAATNSAATSTAFITLPYGQSDVPLEQGVIVRVKLQPSEWGALGVPAPPVRANAISADLLVGQDGVARAVRLVSIE